jgi:hypothetical protein
VIIEVRISMVAHVASEDDIPELVKKVGNAVVEIDNRILYAQGEAFGVSSRDLDEIEVRVDDLLKEVLKGADSGERPN